MKVQAFVAAVPGAMSVVDVYFIDAPTFAASDPSFAAASPAAQRAALQNANDSMRLA